MVWKNNTKQWGLVTIVLHWIVAITIFGLFSLGWWMTELSYYDDWYKRGPFIHRSIGLILFILVLFRLLWRRIDPPPVSRPIQPRWEAIAASITHRLLMLLLMVILMSGYLISTADGRPISLFGWFDIPATLQQLPNQEDIAGAIHWYVACSLMALVGFHIAAALKHQFIDKDGTIARMLGLYNEDNK